MLTIIVDRGTFDPTIFYCDTMREANEWFDTIREQICDRILDYSRVRIVSESADFPPLVWRVFEIG